jgi:hypothetical protein
LALGLATATAPTSAATWVPIQGNVELADGTPLCAMVLANGQYMFSCDETGAFNLNVPLDANGDITLFAFADGFAPFSVTSPGSAPSVVVMQTSAPNSPLITMTRDVGCSGTPNWVRMTGNIESNASELLCAMVLANGQYMFSCDPSLGQYDLTVPVDQNGQVTLFGFADGFQPFHEEFVAPTCTANPICQVPEAQARSDLLAALEGDYPDSYSLQETLLNSGMQAFRELCAIPSDQVSDGVLQRLRDYYYPHFSLILTLYQSEMDSYGQLHP